MSEEDVGKQGGNEGDFIAEVTFGRICVGVNGASDSALKLPFSWSSILSAGNLSKKEISANQKKGGRGSVATVLGCQEDPRPLIEMEPFSKIIVNGAKVNHKPIRDRGSKDLRQEHTSG